VNGRGKGRRYRDQTGTAPARVDLGGRGCEVRRVMRELEELRKGVTEEEIEATKRILKGKIK